MNSTLMRCKWWKIKEHVFHSSGITKLFGLKMVITYRSTMQAQMHWLLMLRKLDKLDYSENYEGSFRVLRDSTKEHFKTPISKKQLILSSGNM